MTIVGFNFEKIQAEKNLNLQGNIKIRNNLNIVEVAQEKFPIQKSQDVLKFTFEYLIEYLEDIGQIKIAGHVLFMDDPKKTKEVLNYWKTQKKVTDDVMQQIINTILFRCNIKALSLSQEVNLPPHIPLPLLEKTNQKKSPSKDYIG